MTTIIDTTPASHLRLPVLSRPDLYTPGTRDAIAPICTPYSRAKPGDILGVFIDYSIFKRCTLEPVVIFLCMGKPGSPPSGVRYDELPGDRTAAAKAAMDLMCALPDRSEVLGLGRDFIQDEKHAFHFELFLTPDFAVFIQTDYEDKVLAHRDTEPLQQETVEECVCLIIPKRLNSSHEVIALSDAVEDMRRIINDALSIYDPQTNEIVELASPDLTDILDQGDRKS